MDILLTKDTKDAHFQNGVITVTDETRQSIAQRLTLLLSTFKGEWFFDKDYGIDYIGQIMGRNRKKTAIDTLFQSAILSEPYVKSIQSFSSDIGTNRVYSATFVAIANTGEVTEPITINVGV